MKYRMHTLVYLLILPLLLVASCKKNESNPLKDLLPFLQPCNAPDCVGTTDITNTPFVDLPSDTGSFTYSLVIPPALTSSAVYFIFTNPTTVSQSYPSVTPNFAMAPIANSAAGVNTDADRPVHHTWLLRDHPDRPIFVGRPSGTPVIQNLLAPGMVAGLTPPDRMDATILGDTKVFNADNRTVHATCRLVTGDITTSNGTRSLNIWVADDQWDGTGAVDGKIHANMMQPVADRFLHADTVPYDDDIYDWDTAIYGVEQDSTIVTGLIPFSPEINILLYDIPTQGVLGYFYAVDFFSTAYYSISNECKIFYIDAPLLAHPDTPGSWSINDAYPSEAMQTIAHEFQHMIHFWQKITRDVNGDDTWVNEMCSEVAEDFVADKLAVDGPRGVLSNDSGVCVTEGRFPTYIENTDLSLAKWYGGNNVYASYAIAYAFGSYIARNFGGAPLFQDIVQNDKSVGTDCINFALTANGYSEQFVDIMRLWGIANMLSQVTDLSGGSKYRYNRGATWATSSSGGITYNLGSINLFNYVSYCQQGPAIRNYIPRGSIAQTSNFYFKAADALTAATYTWNINLPANVTMSVVVLYQ